MKGLMTKEFAYLRHQGRGILLLCGLFAAVFLALAGSGLFGPKSDDLTDTVAGVIAAVPVMMTVLLAINSIGYDEQAKWDAYVLSLPVERDRIVAAKYLYTALLSAAWAALCFLVGLFFLNGTLSRQGLLIIVAASFAAPLLLCSILFPLCFRFGLQKGRFAIAAFFLLPTVATEITKQSGFALSETWQERFWGFSPVIALAVAAVSFLISCAVYRRKQV